MAFQEYVALQAAPPATICRIPVLTEIYYSRARLPENIATALACSTPHYLPASVTDNSATSTASLYGGRGRRKDECHKLGISNEVPCEKRSRESAIKQVFIKEQLEQHR
jgi:hypothetical protein